MSLLILMINIIMILVIIISVLIIIIIISSSSSSSSSSRSSCGNGTAIIANYAQKAVGKPWREPLAGTHDFFLFGAHF